MWIKGKVSEAKGQMVVLPERCTKLRFITGLLFYLELFIYSSFSLHSPIHLPLRVLKIQAPIEFFPFKFKLQHTQAQHCFQPEVWRVLLQILGFLGFFKCLRRQLEAESVPFRWMHRKWEERGSGDTSCSLSPCNMWHVQLFYVQWVTATVCISSRKPLSLLALAFPGCSTVKA